MLKRSLLSVLVVTILSSGLFAQSSKLNKAQKYMDDLNYIGAIELLNQVLDNSDNSEAKMLIAEAYRKISDSENAEFWYGQIVRLSEATSNDYLYYGQSLQRNGKCDMAQEWYSKFLEARPDDIRGQYLVRACDYEEELMTKNSGIYEITHLDFNSNLDDFSPVFYEDGIVFSSERDKSSAVNRIHSWTGNPFLDLFYVDRRSAGGEDEGTCGDYEYGRATKWSKANTKFHDATPSFTEDQSTMYYTRNNLEGKSDDNVVKLKIFSVKNNGNGSFSDPVGLPFNSDEYSVAHPTLTPDGSRLYFSSDMPGGLGGMDLYYADKQGSSWGPPVPLGPEINTEAHEIFPYYHNSGRLYFASDGHIGIGGLDIYYMDDKGNGNFGPIDNIGYPINTVSDDFGVILNQEGTCGYLSSDRSGGAGRDDIYSFRKMAVQAEVYVYDENTKEPIEGATIVDDCTGNTYTTGPDGKTFVDMRPNECCTFAASAETYTGNEKEGCSTADLGEKVFVEIPLSGAMQFDIAGVVYDGDTQLPMEGAMVTLTNDCDEEDQTATTGEDGRYSFKLSEDCCYTIKGSKESYGDSSTEKCTRGLTESKTLAGNLTLNKPMAPTEIVTTVPTTIQDKGVVVIDGITYVDGVPTQSEGPFQPSPTVSTDGSNAIYYLLNIYYDFDQSYIREDAVEDLNKLLKLMNDNPSYVVEIGSHTDARGSNSYNDGLSDRRAKSVVRWLGKKGVAKNRLVARGFGETVNVNNCINNVPCSEKEHQLNRRTEFRILSCEGCETVTTSSPRTDPKVDTCNGCPF
jgi:outer membrane protein OmpA-like peptidoglycan-associated protein/tetratricopeptide (TPR) repeat protein